MTTLYYSPGACSLAPHIVLEWIGVPYVAERVQIGSDAYKAINPNGAVPALREEDGWTLTQAGAILEYLAAKHPEAKLGGASDIRAQAEVHRWASFFTSDMHASFWPVFMPDRYTTDTSDAAIAAAAAAGVELVKKQLAVLDRHMDGREWIIDGGRSIIDAYAFPMLRWASAKVPGGLKDYPNVSALMDRIAADPQVQKVLADEKAAG